MRILHENSQSKACDCSCVSLLFSLEYWHFVTRMNLFLVSFTWFYAVEMAMKKKTETIFHCQERVSRIKDWVILNNKTSATPKTTGSLTKHSLYKTLNYIYIRNIWKLNKNLWTYLGTASRSVRVYMSLIGFEFCFASALSCEAEAKYAKGSHAHFCARCEQTGKSSSLCVESWSQCLCWRVQSHFVDSYKNTWHHGTVFTWWIQPTFRLLFDYTCEQKY